MGGKRKLLVKNQNKGTFEAFRSTLVAQNDLNAAEVIYIYFVKYLILNSCQLLVSLFIHKGFS